MDNIVETIFDRVGAQESLSEQLHAMEKCPHPIPVSAQDLFPKKNKTKLIKWNEVSPEFADERMESSQHAKPTTGIPIIYCDGTEDAAWTDFGKRCFHAVFENSSKQEIEAIVEVFVDYPSRAPHFHLFPSNKSVLRTIESELNDYPGELCCADNKFSLLSHQLRRLQMCLDIMANESTDEMERKHRGRDRRLAFVYDPSTRKFIHR